MDNKCTFSRKEDGVCEYKKNEVRTSQSEVPKTSIKKSDNGEKDEKEEKELNLENIIKKASANPQQRKNQKKYHRASSDCDSSDDEKDEPYYHGSKASTTLTREQALKLSLRKKIDERKLNK
ncbi:285L [Invertebrate iridescent virus 6]|uniref:Uncharacterized protein 285L n=1 Tax=Invertebrate iridescent virus 6 TaxID=176652 RepID=285L_IIV6|nr:285L [Invertebrate iridescent virus 6]Q91FN9.1 RecName: Full=Uncharacterized protein 285L [Invertebrate iridescent virus 6]AAK82146.1 285L [Invertebrate iridescent virus 6]QMS79732.1 hypothetical protein IIV6-T1_279 [Invertebrate iridescent virus 6]